MRSLIILTQTLFLFYNFVNAKPNNSKANLAHPHGTHTSIISFSSDRGVIVDHDAISILLHPEVAERKIVIFSIVGAFRKGKSFLMDYALRFMYANYKSINFQSNPLNETSNWLGSPDEPLTGFSWRGGMKRDTSGIVIWSDVFLHEVNDDKFAIILMDTQGLFDNVSPTDDSRKIFILNQLLSSFLIYNLVEQVNENELEFLRLSIDFAELVNKLNNLDAESENLKPFQDLLFLIRDFSHVSDHPYGLEGGDEYINQLLNLTNQKSLNDVRKNIRKSFENIFGFLLPHPGEKVSTNKFYDGRGSEMDENFKIHLQNLIKWIFKPENLKAKKILGKEVKSKDFYEFIKIYCRAFKSNELPELKNIYELTVDQHLKAITEKLLENYKNSMKKFETPSDKNFKKIINEENLKAKNFALEEFDKIQKMGNENQIRKHRQILADQIDAEFLKFSENLSPLHEKFLELINKSEDLAMKIREEFEKKINEMRKDFTQKLNDEKAKRVQSEKKYENDFSTIKLQSEIDEKEWTRKLKDSNENHQILVKNLKKSFDDEITKKENQSKIQIKNLSDKHEKIVKKFEDQIKSIKKQHEESLKVHQDYLKASKNLINKMKKEFATSKATALATIKKQCDDNVKKFQRKISRPYNTKHCNQMQDFYYKGKYLKSICVVYPPKNYQKAKEFCLANGMDLFAVENSEVYNQFMNFLSNYNFGPKTWNHPHGIWINGEKINGNWITTKNYQQEALSDLMSFQYESKYSGNCLALKKYFGSFEVRNYLCSKLYRSFCEYGSTI